MDTAIIVTIISALGAILAAAVGALLTKYGMEWLKKIPARSIIVGAGLIGLGIGFGVGMAIASAWECREPCLCAKITAPTGTRVRQNAAAFKISSPVEVSWDKTDCVMTIEYYQGEKLQSKYKQKTSGETINVGIPGSGETEIKIWWEGSTKPADSIWVWVQ
jgi:hypothetical protein